MSPTDSKTSRTTVRPLDGLRILELGGGIAASYTTKILAAFGADVIKVEPPGSGDSVRSLAPFVGGQPDIERGITFLDINVGKRSLTLDLSREEGRELLGALVTSSAAVVDSIPPAERDALGIHLETAREGLADLVICRVTPFGEDGPYRDRPASEIVLYGMGHAMHGTGTIKGGPLSMAPHLALLYAGLNAAVPLAASLLRQRKNSSGERIDFSIFESFVASIDRRADSIVACEYCGEPLLRSTDENPESRYSRCQDGFVAVGLTGRVWAPVLGLMGVEEPDRTRLLPPWNDENDHKELLRRWLEWCSTRGRYEVAAALQASGVMAAPVNTVKDLLHDQHLSERGLFKTIEHDVVGEHTIVDVPIRMAATPGRYDKAAPRLGANTDEILSELGVSAEKLSSLRGEGVI